MKTPLIHLAQKFALLLLVLFPALAWPADATTEKIGPALGNGCYIGKSSFPEGDLIEIISVERTKDRIHVKGHYNLVSSDHALLALYITTRSRVAVPTAASQQMDISKGRGDFDLTDPNMIPGMPHVSMYSTPEGKGFAGVYFGTKEEAAEERTLQLDYHHTEVTSSGANKALLNYLGNPVEPPADLDVKYSRAGLSNAVQLAARAAGIPLKKLMIDDSEYPFLVGVICDAADFPKLKTQINQIDGYEYNGSVGSDTCNAFNIIPYRVHPVALRQQIDHRLMLRQQVFYEVLSAQE